MQIPVDDVSHRSLHLVEFFRRTLDVIVQNSGHIAVESDLIGFAKELGGKSQTANYHTVGDLSVEEEQLAACVLDGSHQVDVGDAQSLLG